MASYVRYTRRLLQCIRSGHNHHLPSVTTYNFNSVRAFQETRHLQSNKSDSKVSVLSPISFDTVSTMRSLKGLDDIATYIEQHPKLDHKDYGALFNAIFAAVRANDSKSLIDKFVENEAFESLCRNVKKNSRFLYPKDVLPILRALKFLGVSTNTILGQHLLQQLSKSINLMDVRQLTVLRIILKDSAASPLVDSLKVAVPVVFDSNVRFQLSQEPKPVAEAVVFACEEQSVSIETFEFLLKKVCQVRDRLSPKDAIMILTAFSNRHIDNNLQLSLYQDLMLLVLQDLDKFSMDTLCYLLYSMLDLFCWADVGYYNEELMKRTIDRTISSQVNFIGAGKVLKCCNKVSYPCISLLDYIDDLLRGSKEFHKYRTIAPFLSFIAACSDCSYKPKYFDSYGNRLISILHEYKTKRIPIVKVVLDLTVLNCWDYDLIEFCFSNDFVHEYVSRPVDKQASGSDFSPKNVLNLVNLHQIVKTCYPNGYNGKELPKDILDMARRMADSVVDFPLSGALAQGLGGRKYVLNGVRTNLGHFIDHLIVKRKSGELVVINESESELNSGELIESLKIPGDAFLIGIVVVKPSLYCIDGIKLRGLPKMMLNSMEMQGIATIPVSKYAWAGLNDSEKIPYLMDKIGSRSPADVLSIDSIS